MQGKQAKTPVDLADILPLILAYIAHAKELAVLGACSKGCDVAVKQYIAEESATLLTRHVQASSSILVEVEECVEEWAQGMRWLYKAAGGILPSDPVPILMIHGVPYDVKAHILRLGLNFTYEQLVSAAKQRVAGVEDWVQQMFKLQSTTNLPRVAEQVTCLILPGYTNDTVATLNKLLANLTVGNIADVLHLAVNLRCLDSIARQLISHILQPGTSRDHQDIQNQMTPHLIQELMQTAVERGHYSLLKHLRRFPAVDQLDAAAVRKLFNFALQNLDTTKLQKLLPELIVPKLVKYIDAKIAHQLLVLAVERGSASIAARVSKLEQVQLIDSRRVEELMECAIAGDHLTRDTVDIMEVLSELPAAQRLSSRCITSCLVSIVFKHRVGDPHAAPAARSSRFAWKIFKALMLIGPVQSLPAAALGQVLEVAVAVKHTKAVLLLLQQPAAAQLDADAVYRLLQQSLMTTSCLYDEPREIKALLKLPAIASIPAAATVDICQHAIDVGCGCCIQLLCSKLPKLDAAGLMQLIETVVSRAAISADQKERIVLDLLRQPAAEQLRELQLFKLLPLMSRRTVSGVRGYRDVWEALCDLPAAQQHTAQHQMLSFAMSEGNQLLAQSLLARSAAKSLPAEEVGELLNEAVRRNLEAVVHDLCALPSAVLVQPRVLFEAVLRGMDLKLGSRTLPRQGTARLCSRPLPGEVALRKLCSLWSASITQSIDSSRGQSQQNPQTSLAAQEQQAGDDASTLDPAQQPQVHASHSGSRVQQAPRQQPQDQTSQQSISEASMMLDALLHEAQQQRCMSVIKDLLGTPALASLLTDSTLEQLMRHAAEDNCAEGLRALCALPAAARAAAPTGESMLCCALNQGCITTLSMICQFPAVKAVSRQTAVQLLQQAQKGGKTAVVDLIMSSIPAALEMDESCLVELIQVNLRLSGGTHIFWYMQAPAVERLDVDQATVLLRAAVKAANWSLVESLCTMVPACQRIDAATAESLITTSIVCSRQQLEQAQGQSETAFAVLFNLPGFQQLGSGAVQTLQRVAVR